MKHEPWTNGDQKESKPLGKEVIDLAEAIFDHFGDRDSLALSKAAVMVAGIAIVERWRAAKAPATVLMKLVDLHSALMAVMLEARKGREDLSLQQIFSELKGIANDS